MDHRTALHVLGLEGPAGPEDVKAAYRRLARNLHPDAGGEVQAFQDVQAAFEALRDGTELRTGGPPPQEHSAAVADRWWEAPGTWHEQDVPRDDVDLTLALPQARVVRADTALVARLVRHHPEQWRLVSRAPGAWMNRAVGLLDPELLAALSVATAQDGPRPGHDHVLHLRAPGGRGRRVAGQAPLPPGWVRSRGSDVVVLERRLRPSRDPDATAVRAANAVHALCEHIGWPLGEWSLVRGSNEALG